MYSGPEGNPDISNGQPDSPHGSEGNANGEPESRAEQEGRVAEGLGEDILGATVEAASVEEPMQQPLKMGVWRSRGPRGTDNPPAEIIDEVEHTDGKKYYKLRDPEDHGHEWFALADEVDIVEPETIGTSSEAAREVPDEIPPEILDAASETGITSDDLEKTKAMMPGLHWADRLSFLQTAQLDPKLREHVKRFHSIELHDPGGDAPLSDLPLKDVLEQGEDAWHAERGRRISEKSAELQEMLRVYRPYIPRELPLPSDVEVPPDFKIPKAQDRDPEGAYGLWRTLLIRTYMKRIVSDPTAVRKELHTEGGPIPGVNRLVQRMVSLRVLHTEKREARQSGQRKNYGMLGFGYTRYKEILADIKHYDKDVKDAKRALKPGHRSNYISDDQATPRRKLAESILSIRQREIAHRHGHLGPQIPRNYTALHPEVEEMVS